MDTDILDLCLEFDRLTYYLMTFLIGRHVLGTFVVKIQDFILTLEMRSVGTGMAMAKTVRCTTGASDVSH
jgi:hypothetical protein